jgi:glycosyltransferase involved in cell wall biosynthesis
LQSPIHRAQVIQLDVGDPRWRETEAKAPGVFAVFTADGAVVGEALVAAAEWPPPSLPAAVASRAAEQRLRSRLEHTLRGAPRAEPDDTAVTLVIASTAPASLSACLDSVAALAHAPAHTIVLGPSEGGGGVEDVCAERGVRLEAYDGPLAAAKNRCLVDARTPLVAFASDDCVIDRDWFSRIGSPFRDRLVQAVIGYEVPLRLETRAECLHRLRPTGAHPGEPKLMCLRASVIDDVGPFDTRLGPGSRHAAGDVGELLSRTLRAGYRVKKDPERTSRRAHPSGMRDLRRERAAELRSAGFRSGARDLASEAGRQLARDPLRAPLSLVVAETFAVVRAAFTVRSASPRGQARESRSDEGSPPIRVRGPEFPDLSVAIASHNRRESLRSVLLHLAGQAYPTDRYEVTVVLDGGSDGSAEMVRALDVPYALRGVEQEQRGLAASRNRGAEEAQHPLVVFLDDDLMPVSEFLAAHGAAQRGTGGSVVLGHSPPARLGSSWWAQEIRAWWEDRYRRMREPDHRWSFLDFADGNMSLPVSLLARTGGWKDGFARRQDWELAIRLLDAGIPFSFRDDATAWHHFELSLKSALANQRAVGASDVALARQHPRWRSQLQLAGILSGSERSARRHELVEAIYERPRMMGALARAGRDALPLLELARARGTWRRTLGRLMTAEYLFGVRDALSDESEFDELAAEIARDRLPRVMVALSSEQPLALVEEAGPIEVCVADAGEEPWVCVPGALPGEQWDWDVLLNRIVDEADARARLQPASDA